MGLVDCLGFCGGILSQFGGINSSTAIGSFGDSANLMGHNQSKEAPHDSIRYVFGFCSSVVEVDFFFSLIWSGWRGDWAL